MNEETKELIARCRELLARQGFAPLETEDLQLLWHALPVLCDLVEKGPQ